jgi:hypothetical protein
MKIVIVMAMLVIIFLIGALIKQEVDADKTISELKEIITINTGIASFYVYALSNFT